MLKIIRNGLNNIPIFRKRKKRRTSSDEIMYKEFTSDVRVQMDMDEEDDEEMVPMVQYPRVIRSDRQEIMPPTRVRPRAKSIDTLTSRKEADTATKSVIRFRHMVSMVIERKFSKSYPPKIWNTASLSRTVRLNSRLLVAIEENNNTEVERLLLDGANPNATCRRSHLSACHVAAYCNSDALQLLIKHGAKTNRRDKFGRSPLHLAAWSGNNLNIAMILDFPAELQSSEVLTNPETEEKLKALRSKFSAMIDDPCEFPSDITLKRVWADCYAHKCKKYMSTLTKFFSGWTPLHVASCAAHDDTTRLLLAAGANPNSKDAIGLSPLDVAGSACFQETGKVDVTKYVKTVETLIQLGGELKTKDINPSTSRYALHTAVQLCSVEAIRLLLNAGASIAHRNPQGNTPLHECIMKQYKEPLQVLTEHGSETSLLNLTNQDGYTALQSAVLASWIPGVSVALDAGADVTFSTDNKLTAIHLAAREGNIDILTQLFSSVPYMEYADDLEDSDNEKKTPLYCAILSGNLACVQAIIDEGASTHLGKDTYDEFGDLNEPINMIVHVTAEAGTVEILEFLLNYDKTLEMLLDYRCPALDDMIPVECAAFHGNNDTYMFLLKRTISNRINEFNPSKLLDIIISNHRKDMLHNLLIIYPDAIRMSIANGYYPLHEAIKYCDRIMILLIINNGADLSQRDDSGSTAISLFFEHRSMPTELIASLFDTYIRPSYPSDNEHFQIAVDYDALLPTVEPPKNERQMRVLVALLKTGNGNNQRKLLAHPLIESFLYLKWKPLWVYYYWLIFMYALFVISLSIYIVSYYYYKSKRQCPPFIMNNVFWHEAALIALAFITVQEILCTTMMPKSWKARIFSIEFWLKLAAYSLAVIAVSIRWYNLPNTIESRHFATLTLTLVWVLFAFLLSKLPETGYYMHMFWNVFLQIIGILASFSFLVILFSICFMMEFDFIPPFDGPFSAFAKTLVMMTSEFDYSDFTEEVEKETAKTTIPTTHHAASVVLLRVIFLIFLVLAAITLMNLMTGVAVHDVQNLIQDGDLRRLEKQVEFLDSLEITRGTKISLFKSVNLLPFRHIPRKIRINPVHRLNAMMAPHITERLINIAVKKRDIWTKIEKESMEIPKYQELLQAINDLKSIVTQMQNAQQKPTSQ